MSIKNFLYKVKHVKELESQLNEVLEQNHFMGIEIQELTKKNKSLLNENIELTEKIYKIYNLKLLEVDSKKN